MGRASVARLAVLVVVLGVSAGASAQTPDVQTAVSSRAGSPPPAVSTLDASAPVTPLLASFNRSDGLGGSWSATSGGDTPAPVGGAVRKGQPVKPGTGAPVAALSTSLTTSGEGPTTPLLDNFNRADGPLGPNWAQITAQGTLAIQSNVVKASSGIGFYYWTPAQFGPDVEAYAISGGVGCCQLQQDVRLFLRVQNPGTSLTGYELINWFGVGGWGWWIRKYTAGTFTDLAQVYTDVWGRMLFRAVGTTLQGWGSNDGVTWTKVIEASDSTFQGSGAIGFGMVNSQPWADDFGGGAYAGPAGSPPEQMTGVVCDDALLCRGSVGVSTGGTMVEPVNTLTGAFVHAENDLNLTSTGVPFEWTRSYTSSDTASGRFGPGWTDTYQTSLAVQPNGDVIVKGDEGQRVLFTSLGGGAFDGAPGARATLTTLAGGYGLTTQDQLVYEFDTAGKLLSKKDRNGQGVVLAYDGSGRLQTVTDSAGRTATVSYNASSLVSGVSLSDGRSVSYGYTSGRLTSFTDVRGKQWTYSYDAGGRLATIVDPLNHTQVSNVYDATSGRVTSQTDATNKTTQFAWDEATRTATITDPNNKVWKDVYVGNALFKRIDGTNKTTEFAFDADLNTSSVKSPIGETTSMTHDGNGNMLTVTAPPSLSSAQKTFVYNTRNDPTNVTDARGTVTTYTYTAAGNVETVTQGGQQQTSYTYDAQGRVLTATDANGKTTSYTYDTAGNVASMTQPDPDGPGPLGQPKTTFTYDSQGNVLTRVDPKGNVTGCGCAAQYTTTFTYNPASQLLTETDPLGHVLTTNVYDDAGRLSSTTDANSHTTSYTYDNANRVLTETRPDPDGAGPLAAPVTTYTYDNAGNKKTETDPRGNTTTLGYDDANRLASSTGPDPDGAGPLVAPVTTYAYDGNGNLGSTVDPRGNVTGANPADYRTSYTYDAAGRVKTTTDPLGNVTTNVYDAVGNLTSVTDPNNHTASYTYDFAGRILTVTAPDPDGAGPLTAPVTTYTYDPDGNRLTRANANSRVTTWAYDALNRVVSETWPDPDGAGAQTPSVTTMAYDINGNLLSRTDPNGNGTPTAGDGTTTYAYDRADRPTGIDYSDTTPDVTYTLDDVGNRLTMVSAGVTETRSYDNLDRLLSVTRGTDTFSYLYDAASNTTRRTYPDGAVADYTYDPLNRMTSLASGGQTTNYGYDVASNPTQRNWDGNHNSETRTYDRAARLIDLDTKKIGTTVARFVITRDAVGNPTQIVRTGELTETQTYGYDNMDRLTSVCFQAGSCPGGSDPFIRWTYDGVGNRLTEQRPNGTTNYTYDQADRMLTAGSATYGYDRNGNATSAAFTTATYDLANRLTQWVHGDSTFTYSYNGDGIRTQATETGGSGQTTKFLWDTNHALPQLALERDGSNNLLRRYQYGLQPVSLTTPSGTSFYIHDPLGSTANLISTSGTVQKTYGYEPYGNIRSQSGTLDQPVRFTGQYFDPTGLYHLRARQYVPYHGRFMSVDPAGQSIRGAAVSAYVYADGRPLVMIDPSGATLSLTGIGPLSADSAASPNVADAAACQVTTLAQRELCGFTFFLRKGLTTAQSAGIIGNLWFESGRTLNPRQWEFRCAPNERRWDDSNCGVGIAQWTFVTRKQGLLRFAGSVNRALTFQVQIAYVWRELESGLGSALRNLRMIRGSTLSTVNRATERFMIDYENPRRDVAQLAVRQREARSVFRRYAG